MSGNVVRLIEKIVTSTPNTLRTVLVILLVIGAVVGGLWLLRADFTAGPISITGRETTAPCANPGGPVACGR
ncbi:hypothetical protein [Amycolatopsis sp. cmx-4-83]|uniref:hypothetical protein n=1 Tax=Amycolatopsis sp. cmx-4-83 TaxID=2790940 RepID=UPI00397BB62A